MPLQRTFRSGFGSRYRAAHLGAKGEWGCGGLIFGFLPPPPLPFGPHGALPLEAERPPTRLLPLPLGSSADRRLATGAEERSRACRRRLGRRGKENRPVFFLPFRRRRSSADAAYKSRARALLRHPSPPAVARPGLASQRRRAPPLLSPPASARAVAGHGLARARRPARPAVRPGRAAGLCAPAQKVHAGRLSPAAGALSLLV